MAFTDNQNLESPTQGAADWDTALRSNFTILDRGFHATLQAATDIGTGEVVALDTNGNATLYDAASMDAIRPAGIAHKSVSSGEEGTFVMMGIVGSLDTLSGFITLGQPAFVDPASPGFLVSSTAGVRWNCGFALTADTVFFNPANDFPLETTETASNNGNVGDDLDFTFTVGHRGYVRKLQIIADSADAYKVQLHSAATRTSSELLYETETTSVDGGAQDFDVNTIDFLDAAGFPFKSTDASTPWTIYGRISVQSASSVNTVAFGFTLEVDRFA